MVHIRLMRALLAGVVSVSMVTGPVGAQQGPVATTPAVASPAALTTPAISAADPLWEQEFALWQAASAGKTAADYDAYLAAYPTGKFAAIARSRATPAVILAPVIDKTEVAAIPAAVAVKADTASHWQQEFALWTAASGGNTVDEYQSYLQAYPAGKFASIAQGRIVKLTDQSDMAEAQDSEAAAQMRAEQMAMTYMTGTPLSEDGLLDRAGRREVQGRLSSLGYATGGTDGVLGGRSRAALSQWQATIGAPVTGFLSYDQLAKLRGDTGAVYAQWLASRPAPVRRSNRVLIGRVDNSTRDAVIALGVLGIGAAIIGGAVGRRHHGYGR